MTVSMKNRFFFCLGVCTSVQFSWVVCKVLIWFLRENIAELLAEEPTELLLDIWILTLNLKFIKCHDFSFFSISRVLDLWIKKSSVEKILFKFGTFCKKNQIRSPRFSMIFMYRKFSVSTSSPSFPSSTTTIMVPEVAPLYAVNFPLIK